MEGHTATPEFTNPDITNPVTQAEETLEFDSADKLAEGLHPDAQVNTLFMATDRGQMVTRKGPFTHQDVLEEVEDYQQRTGARVTDITLDIIR